MQVPSYNYVNTCSAKSILKKQPKTQSGPSEKSKVDKRIQFRGSPTVHCITPIENEVAEEYYGSSMDVKMGRGERRWVVD